MSVRESDSESERDMSTFANTFAVLSKKHTCTFVVPSFQTICLCTLTPVTEVSVSSYEAILRGLMLGSTSLRLFKPCIWSKTCSDTSIECSVFVHDMYYSVHICLRTLVRMDVYGHV